MSNSRRILEMLKSRADGDDEQFYTIALQVAAAEARQGHREVAQQLRDAVEKARSATGTGQTVAVPFAAPRGELLGVLEARSPKHSLSDVVMSKTLRGQLDDVVREQSKRDWLREHAKTPSRKLLFLGPPGSGKTMTAEGLASTLRIPLFVIRLDNLITRYMGETAAKLRLIFEEIGRRRAVYLFDEFDALGANRGAGNDVAEMRRVLNSFLQFMEEPSATDSLVVGATNYPNLLDRALLRRFDLVLPFSPPSDDEIRLVVKSNLRPMKYPNLAWKKIIHAAQGLSQAELVRAAEKAVKSAILDQRNVLKTDDIIASIEERQTMREAFSGLEGKAR